MTSIDRSHSRVTPDLSSTILLDLRQATESNSRKSCRLWRRKQSRLKWTISCMLFGRFRYLSLDTHWWSVLWRKVLFGSEQCSASIAIGNGVFWHSEGRKRFLSPHLSSSSSKSTFYSTRNRDLYQVRWFDDSDLWHISRWRCQSPKCGGTSGKEVQKTFVRVYFSAACRCLLRRQVLVNLVPNVDLTTQLSTLSRSAYYRNR